MSRNHHLISALWQWRSPDGAAATPGRSTAKGSRGPERDSKTPRKRAIYQRPQQGLVVAAALGTLSLPTCMGHLPLNAQGVADPGSQADTNRPVRVIWMPDPPYALNHGGVPTGLEIDLWRTIAETRKIPYQIERAKSFEALLSAVSSGKADIAMGGILIDENRSKRFHFSFPTATSTFKIYTLADQKPTAFRLLEVLLSKETLLILLGLILIACFFAIPVWAMERSRPEFDGTRKRHQLIFILQKTLLLSTDHTKQTKTRLISIASLFARVILTAYFASYILEIARSTNSKADQTRTIHFNNAVRQDRTFAATRGSLQESILRSAGAKIINCGLTTDCLQLLYTRKADAMLSDTQSMAAAIDEGSNNPKIAAETDDLMPLFSAYGISNNFAQDPRSRSINDAIARSYYDGTYIELSRKWLRP